MINALYQRLKDYVLNLPLMTWVLLGFAITFFFLFVVPIFFDPSQTMKFNQYIAFPSPIGRDFREIVASSSSWLGSGVVPSILYPSFTLIFFSPFTLLNVVTGYKILALIILIGYVLATLILPQWINKQRSISVWTMLIFITGIASYGLQFELERGQWNLIAFMLALAAIHIFHDNPRRRWLGYVFFTISVQLKLYPAIFVFALVDDWSDWKNNITRFVGLGLVNIAALFILGVSPVLKTFGSLAATGTSQPAWPFNLSISSFTSHILSLHSLPHKRLIFWLQANGWLPQLLLIGFFVVCFLIIVRQAYKMGPKGFNPCVFMACSIGALIIPSISYDYKLAALPAAVILLIPAFQSFRQQGNRLWLILLAFLFSVAYSSTLYPTVNKPEWLPYNLPALLLILVITTILSCLSSDGDSNPSPDVPGFNSATP